ncbi:AraC family transcriptional regulator [Pedobacter duraquae]|uniref:AraC family transcriptional regulator n=1 Tax=Pedobacter duraquae TaxID=425511 RepID=A0A4R6IK58_9SPHI|nr:AraC family transcriptional regulator [Pedobacter duraquae]TDO22401.1 AraC family transcriptional regulator [Pedobacter duraquae]
MASGIPLYDIGNFESYKDEGILISRFGYYAKNNQHLHKAHRHSFYHLVYFSKGTGTQYIDFKKFRITPGQIYFMAPGQVHSWDFEDEPDGYIINFSKSYFSSFLHNANYINGFQVFSGVPEEQVIELNPQLQQEAVTLFESMLQETPKERMFSQDMVRTLLLQLLIKVSRVAQSTVTATPHSYNQTVFRNFLQLIDEHYLVLRFPKEYAEILYVTPNHLNALCKDLAGNSAGELIRARVILESKRSLINLSLSIAEIAERLNFKDNSYFNRFFKKHEGITPEKFRKSNVQ